MDLAEAMLEVTLAQPRPQGSTVVLSLNLTDPSLTQTVDPALYSAPLFLSGALVVMEIVFWSAPYGCWIVLVRDRTGRPLPEHMREVALDDLDYYERSILGIKE